MTVSRAEWDRIRLEHLKTLGALFPERSRAWRRAKAHERAGIQTGTRNRPPAHLVVVARNVAAQLSQKEVLMLLRKAVVALVFGVGATAAVFNLCLADGTIDAAEWSAIASAFISAAWGKFSSNTTILAPSRKGETVAGPDA